MPTSGCPIPPEMDVSAVYDAIVVGAGPAGCAAAYDLLAAGHTVLLLDKAAFPRDKACAGGLTAKAVRALRYPIGPVARASLSRMRFEGQKLAPITLTAREPICTMTVRAELDAYCLQQTRAAGAIFRTIAPIQRIERAGDEIRLITHDEVFTGRFLVGADGVQGQVRTLCAESSWFTRGFALEVRAAPGPKPVELTFDFGVVGDGYGWIFPKQDHLNVGLYVQSATGGLTRAALLDYVGAKAETVGIDRVVGQYLGMGAGDFQSQSMMAPWRGRVLLAGDAGGFVDALTGEGIYGALLSGQAAAAAIASELRGGHSAEAVFEQRLRSYRQTLRFSARAAKAFYADPERGFRLMRLPLARRAVVRTYTHGLNINSLPMKLITALARRI